MADRVVKLAVIGAGGIWNGAHTKNLALLGGNQVVAVCDIAEPALRKAAEANKARAYDHMDKLFAAEKDLDAVIACTPPTVRRQVVEGAARLHLPVFVEKPPAFALDDARQIVRIVRERKTPVFVGFMYRHLPAVDRLRELIAGRPVNLVQSSFFCPAATGWNLPGWFYLKDRSGGHVLDQAIHVMDLVRFLAGDITRVFTLGNNVVRPKAADFTIEDSSSTVLRFAGGASGTHVHSWAHSEFVGFVTIIGKDYRLTLQLDQKLSGFVGDRKVDEVLPTPPAGATHHYYETQAFLQAVRTGDFTPLRSPYPDAAKSLATVVAMNESIESQAPVDVAADF
jgi:predicted dehydrogenase